MVSQNQWFVILNPASGNGAGKRKWPKIKQLLETHLFHYQFAVTTHENHSSNLALNAVKQGFRKIICIGGDGTIHNTINGIMRQNVVDSSKVVLGVIPVGTGNDWVKTHGIAKHIESAIKTIKHGAVKTQDIGKIEFLKTDKPSVYFNNLAGVGFDAYVVSRVEKMKSLGSLAYIFGALRGLFSAQTFKANIHCNSKAIEANALMVLVGLCNYSGGGMQLTESPQINDGLFDISIANNFTGLDIVKNIAKLYNGSVTQSRKIITLKTSEILIEVMTTKLPFIQADGELIGTGNFKVTLQPSALSFYA